MKKNFDKVSSDDRHKVYFSGEGRHEYGAGFLVHKDMVSAVLGCRPVSSRPISIRLKVAPFNITIIKVYEPTFRYEVDNCCQHLYETRRKTYED